MGLDFDVEMNKFPDNVIMSTTASAIETWLDGLNIDNAELNIKHKYGFYEVFVRSADYGINFNGTSSRCLISDASILDPANTLSIALRANITLASVDLYGTIISKGTADYQIGVFTNGDIRFRFVDDSNERYMLTLSEAITTNTNTHIAFTCGGGELIAYLDGSEEDSTDVPVSVTRNKAFDLYLGGTSPLTDRRYLPGVVDKVRIYSDVLTPAEVLSDMTLTTPLQDNLILWLECNEGTGTTVRDKTDNANNGVLTNCTWVAGL